MLTVKKKSWIKSRNSSFSTGLLLSSLVLFWYICLICTESFGFFSSNLVDEKLWIAYRPSIPCSYEKSLQFFKAIKVIVSKGFKRNLFCSPSHLSSFSQQIKISNALGLLLLSLIWYKLLSGSFMVCCVKSFRQVNKKCPWCIKTIIHTLANVVCNFKP